MTKTKVCEKCGAPFAASRTGVTVRCPACRGRRTAPAATGRTVTTCYCGKTVVAVAGRPTGVTCPRECAASRSVRPAVELVEVR